MDWQAINDPTKPQCWMIAIPCSIIILSILFAFDAIKNRSRGRYSGWDFLDTLSFIGSVIGWIFKGIGIVIIFIISLFTKQPPSFSHRKTKKRPRHRFDSDDSEDGGSFEE